MRLLILGVSALSLSACSLGGLGFGTENGAHTIGAPAGYGQWQGGYDAGYANAGQTAGHYGYPASPCSAPAPQYVPTPQYVPAPPVQVSPCGQPAYVPPTPPCYQPQPQPCGALPMQPMQHSYQQSAASVSYPTGYPTHYPSQPYPAPTPPANYGCAANTCAGTYSVSPYGSDYNADHSGHMPNPYAYGQAVHEQTSYGYSDHGAGYAQPHKVSAPRLRRAPHLYGTLGAVWYDLDNPYAGVQGRLGYQSASFFGAEVEGSIGVVGETSPFNQAVGGGVLSGEFKDGVDYSAGIFGTARLPLSRNISAHGRVGYHTTRTYSDVDFDNNPNQETTLTLDGLAYGGGLQMDVTPVDAVRLDFTRYDDNQGGKDSVALAYLRRF